MDSTPDLRPEDQGPPGWREGRDDVVCVFHNRAYPHHDFTYGEQCRRCGVWRSGPASGAPAVPDAPPPRPRTPDVRNPDGTTTVRVARHCNGCGESIGDADDADMNAAICAYPLPDVRGECPRCTPPADPQEG